MIDRELDLDQADHARALWALGDYGKVAGLLAEMGPDLVQACGIGPGHRVLDVAAGTGNVAVAAAAAGADVVASDLTPELLDAGHRAAAELGLRLTWVEANAQRLPFADDEFDVVTSAIGAMFAPNHQVVADELVRVCRPGGRIGMINWPPDGFVAEFFGVFAAYQPPPPPGTVSPLSWGSVEHVRAVFGDRVQRLETSRHVITVADVADPPALCAFYKQYFGPTIATYAALGDDPDRVVQLDQDFLEFAIRFNRAEPGASARYEYPYLRVVADVTDQ